jgi:predicted nuclease with TOPRIM domain
LDEETIKRLFVTAVNKLLTNKKEIFANFDMMKKMLFDTTALDAEHEELQSEMAVVAEIIQKCVDENARITQSQDDYLRRYEGLVGRFETAKRRFEEVCDLRSELKARSDMVEAFIDSLKKQDGLVTDFDEQLWYSLVDYATVNSEDDVQFKFKDGTVIPA